MAKPSTAMSTLTERLENISSFLSHPLPSTIIQTHPNDLGGSSFQPQPEWYQWWDWPAIADTDDQGAVGQWLLLLQYYSSSDPSATTRHSIPSSLRELMDQSSNLAIPRHLFHPFSEDSLPDLDWEDHEKLSSDKGICSLPGMSPKKTHEVVRMSDFLQDILSSSQSLKSVQRVVDIGAGQAYLSRMLRDRLGLQVLALDWSEVQSHGAAKKDTSKANRISQEKQTRRGTKPFFTAHSIASPIGQSSDEPKIQSLVPESQTLSGGSLVYITTEINTESLLSSTKDWVINALPAQVSSTAPTDPVTSPPNPEPVPVIFVALHACGSLTVDILRAFVSANLSQGLVGSSKTWVPRAAIVVGCCYNMMRPEDFPLSKALRLSKVRPPTLTSNHLQLAAQVPSQWTRTEECLRDARLAMRKVVWRALLEDALRTQREADGASNENIPRDQPKVRRLGRLNDSAYTDWETFVKVVQTKMGLPQGAIHRADSKLERRIEVFHALRCILGPVVESLILLDRLAWVQEELDGLSFDVELVNLFDQEKGSGRNVAIVIRST